MHRDKVRSLFATLPRRLYWDPAWKQVSCSKCDKNSCLGILFCAMIRCRRYHGRS